MRFFISEPVLYLSVWCDVGVVMTLVCYIWVAALVFQMYLFAEVGPIGFLLLGITVIGITLTSWLQKG